MPDAILNRPNQPAIGNFRWIVCALLFLATTINYIDRQILAVIKEILDKEIGWTNEEFGWVNASFQLSYAVGLLGFGWLVDKFGTKTGYAVSIIAWSIAAMCHAFVGSFRGFIMVRVALGLGEGGNFPSAVKAVALWFPKSERAFAASLFNAGTNAGALLAPAVIPWMAFTWGWKSTFVAAGILGILWLFLWIPFYNVPEKSKHVGEAELEHIRSDKEDEKSHERVSWLSLLGYRQTWSFVVSKFLTDPVWWFFLIWLPDFFNKTRGLEIKKSWIHIVTIYAIVTVLSIFGGWVTGWLTTRGWSVTRARKTGMFIFALCVLPILFVKGVGDWPAVFLIALAASAHQAWSANLYTTVSDMFPKRAVASVIGLGGMAGSVGAFFFPIVTGRMLDHYMKINQPATAYGILFAICAFMYLIAFGLNHFLAPRYEPVQLRESAASA